MVPSPGVFLTSSSRMSKFARLDAVVFGRAILAWLARQDHPNELQVLGLDLAPLNYAIALPFDSPLRRKLNIVLVDTLRSSWWREVVGRYLGAE